MCAVLVADHADRGGLPVGEHAALVVALAEFGVETLQDALGDAGGVASQIGVDRTRMSQPRIVSRISGQASPPPMSTSTPGLTSWSATRITLPVTPWSASAAMACSASSCELDGFGDGESVQTSATARSGVVLVVVSM